MRAPQSHVLANGAAYPVRHQANRIARVVRMSTNPHIVEAEQLRKLSDTRTATTIKRWANQHGVRVLDGAEGPWTTIEALNAALGVRAAENDESYSPDIL